MTRTLAARFAGVLLGHAASEKYPTRSVEYMLAWITIMLALSFLTPAVHMERTQFLPLLHVIPDQRAWGAMGLCIGAFRLFAMVRNGSWSKSPWLRLLGASLGFQFWFLITALNASDILYRGNDVFPMLFIFPVFLFFEAYSCFRCGQDARRAIQKSARLTDSNGNG